MPDSVQSQETRDKSQNGEPGTGERGPGSGAALYTHPSFRSFPGPWQMHDDAFWEMCARIEAKTEEIVLRQTPELQFDLAYGKRQHRDREIAVVQLSGVMVKFAEPNSKFFVSTHAVARQLIAAADDPAVQGIALLIDSPGGTAKGTVELAEAVKYAASKKKVIGLVDEMCCSAALFVGAQCTQLYAANAGAMIGSLGTMQVVPDLTKQFEMEGITLHVRRVGEWKGMLTPGAPVTAEQLAKLDTRLVVLNNQFKAAVQAGRSFTASQTETLFDGSIWLAEEAEQKGLIDGIASFDDVVAMMFSGNAGDKNSNHKPQATRHSKKGATMSDTNDADKKPVAATAAELKAAFPKASPEFRLEQLEKGATLAEAHQAFGVHLAEQLAAKEAEIAKLKETPPPAGKPKGVPPIEGQTQMEDQAADGLHPFLSLARQIERDEKVEFQEAKGRAKARNPEAFLSYIELKNKHQSKEFVHEVLGVK